MSGRNSLVWGLLALIAGTFLPFIALLNARLGRSVNSALLASLASFAIGLLSLGIACLLTRQPFSRFADAVTIPPWVWIGGVLAALYLVIAVTVTPRLGVATAMSLVIAGQLAMALLLDHLGALGLPKQPINWSRAVGVALLLAGVLLMQFSKR